MDDDAILAGVLRRFLSGEEDGWGSLAYVSLNGEHNGFMHPYLTIDGSTGTLSEVEVAALRRAMEGKENGEYAIGGRINASPQSLDREGSW